MAYCYTILQTRKLRPREIKWLAQIRRRRNGRFFDSPTFGILENTDDLGRNKLYCYVWNNWPPKDDNSVFIYLFLIFPWEAEIIQYLLKREKKMNMSPFDRPTWSFGITWYHPSRNGQTTWVLCAAVDEVR